MAAGVARRSSHVLVTGESGAGKELVARAIHALSSRRARPLVARNAATIPEGLIDAELFGNVRNYPNVGMPERPGLIGEADRSTLYLDEIGELPFELQAHLLRVLDDGEYQRLGEANQRVSDFRLIAASNRDPEELKHDLLARLEARVQVRGLTERRADIPLLTRHLLTRMAEDDPSIQKRFFQGDQPRVTPGLIRGLVRHAWTTHARELRALLGRAVDTSTGNYLERSDNLELHDEAGTRIQTAPTDPGDLDPRWIQEVLDRNNGVQERAWRDLGLRSRHQLTRLIKKHGLLLRRQG
jgi:two-component system nitrogen regulation response regulator GlnG/two-component system response regulator HydG